MNEPTRERRWASACAIQGAEEKDWHLSNQQVHYALDACLALEALEGGALYLG